MDLVQWGERAGGDECRCLCRVVQFANDNWATGQGGPSINVGGVLQAGAKYTITGYVRLTNGESASNANLTIKRSDPSCSGGTCYDTIGTYQVPGK